MVSRSLNIDMQPNYRKYVTGLILVAAVIRMLVAASVELGNDEVYYWTYSQHLEWNYFDHPPMVALWIRIFTGNLWLQSHELFVRLGSIISGAVGTWLMYKIGTQLQSERVGWIAACLYNASLYASIIAGLFIMPDSPQMVFWCACLYLLLKILASDRSWRYWLLFGLCAGLCIMSKVHGAFLWIGFVLFILVQKRAYLKRPQLYVSLLLTAVIASPILIWNINNHFATFQYHGERVAVQHVSFNATSFFRELFGEVFYNNPIVVFLSFFAIRAVYRNKKLRTADTAIYLWIALPMIALLLFVSMFRNTLPHWSGPAYVTLLPITAVYVEGLSSRHITPRYIRWSLGFILFILVLGMGVIKSYPGTLGSKSGTDLGKGDFTLDMYGWEQAGKAFEQLYASDVQKRLVQPGTPVVCYKWFPAAHEEYYFCRRSGIQMVGIGSALELHQYSWRKYNLNFDQAYCIVPSNENYNVQEKYAPYFTTIDSIATIKNYRSNKLASRFYVYRLQGFKKNYTPQL